MEVLQKISSSEDETVRKMAKGALWQIEGKGEKECNCIIIIKTFIVESIKALL